MKLQDRNGIPYPTRMKLKSWIVTGPPGSGKSYLINRIGGWPGEVCLDITMKKWWAVEPLTHRPREIHFSLPFKGEEDRFPVYEEKWRGTGTLPELDLKRIRIPNKKKFILAPDWRARFVFDFVLPPPAWLLQTRRDRFSSDYTRLVDIGLTPKLVTWQVHIYWLLAWHFHQSGLQVMLRPFNTARPFSFPVLKKIIHEKGAVAKGDIDPGLDWSRLRNVRHWVEQAAPEDWRP